MPATFEEDLYESFANLILGEKLPLDIVNAQTGLVMIPANKKITRTLIRMMVNDYLHLEIDPSPVNNRLMKIIYDMKKSGINNIPHLVNRKFMPQIKRLTRNQQTTMRIKKNLILDRNYLADAEIKEGQMGYLVLCTSELERFFNAPRSARHGEAFTLTASDKPFLGSKSVEVHIFDLENKDITRASWIDPEYPECPYGGTLMHGAEDILIQIFGKVGRHTVYFRVTPKKTEK